MSGVYQAEGVDQYIPTRLGQDGGDEEGDAGWNQEEEGDPEEEGEVLDEEEEDYDGEEEPDEEEPASASQRINAARARHQQNPPHRNSRGQHAHGHGSFAGQGGLNATVRGCLARASGLITRSRVAIDPAPTWHTAGLKHACQNQEALL